MCGSALVAEINGGEVLATTAATLDGEVEIGHAAHMFWQSKASWCELNDDLPKYDTYPPSRTGSLRQINQEQHRLE